MAAYSEAHAKTVTLTGSQEDTFAFTGPARSIELAHHGNTTDVVYYRTNGTVTAAGDDCDVLLPGERLSVGTGGLLHVISAGTPTITVSGRP